MRHRHGKAEPRQKRRLLVGQEQGTPQGPVVYGVGNSGPSTTTNCLVLLSIFVVALAGAMIGSYAFSVVNYYATNHNQNKIQTLKDFKHLVLTDTVYINVTGDDSNPGTHDKPVATFQRAVELTRFAKNATFYVGPGTFNLGDPMNNHSVPFISSTKIVGSFDTLFSSTIVNDSNTEFNTTFEVSDAMVPGAYDRQFLLVYRSDTNVTAYQMIVSNTADSITIVGTVGLGAFIGFDFAIVEPTSVITWNAGPRNMNIGGFSTTSWSFFRFDMTSTVILNTNGASIHLTVCEFIGGPDNNTDYHIVLSPVAGGFRIETCKFTDLQRFRAVRSGDGDMRKCMFVSTNTSLNTNNLVLEEGTYNIQAGLYMIDAGLTIRNAEATIDRMMMTGQDVGITSESVVYMDRIRIESDLFAPLRVLTGSKVTLFRDNFIGTTVDSGSVHGAIEIQQNSFFTTGGGTTTISVADGSPTYHLFCDTSTVVLGADVVVHGKSTQLLNAKACKVQLRTMNFDADQTNDGTEPRISAVNTNFDVFDSDVTLSNMSNGIHVAGGESITLTDSSTLTVHVNDNNALLISKQTPITLDDDTVLDLETLSTSDPCVVLNSQSSITLAGTATIVANYSTCIQISEQSKFLHANSSSTSLYCNVTELTLSDMSDGVYNSGSSATLLPGTVDKTMIGDDLYNTSFLIASTGTPFEDSGQLCRLLVTA